MKYSVFFFANGNTAVCTQDPNSAGGGEQVPELQESWLRVFAQHLESKIGVDIYNCDYYLPDGKTANLVLTDSGWNWRIK